MRLSTTAIAITAVIWILGNVALPLIVNAIERLYQSNIDRIVSRTLTGVAVAAMRLLHVVFIVIFLPNIIVLWILQRAVGPERLSRMCSRWWLLNDSYSAIRALTGPQWRQHIFARRAWRIKRPTRERQQL